MKSYSPQDLADHVGMHPLTVREYLDDFDISTPGWQGWSKEEFEDIANIITQGARKDSPIKIKVGADPEFEVKDSSGGVRRAHNYLSSTTAAVGVDGASHTGEFRPSPGSPERVTSNIRKLISKVQEKLPPNYNIGAGGGTTYPLGGHIHISGRPVSDQLLDKFETFITNPLNAKSNTDIRRSYNSPKNWRRQPHGWEYRSPCSWLAHPIITRGALVIAYALCELSDEQLEKIKSKRKLISTIGLIRGRYAKEFWEFLKATPKLEAINVFRAWDIEEEGLPIPTAPEGKTLVSITEDDSNMLPVTSMGIYVGSSSSVGRIVGARNTRFNTYTIALPPSIVPQVFKMYGADLRSSFFKLESPIGDIKIEGWNMPSVGISWNLRKKLNDSGWRNNYNTSDSLFAYLKLNLQKILNADSTTSDSYTASDTSVVPVS